MFVMLGLLASAARLPGAVLPALVAGSVLVLIARLAAVMVSTLPLRGAVASAGIPVLGRAARGSADRSGDDSVERPLAGRHRPVRPVVCGRQCVHPVSGPDYAVGVQATET